MAVDSAPQPTPEAKPGTPRSPATRELGMKATLLFPTREITESFYLPLIYTACRTCYSELAPDDIFERAVDGRISPAATATAGARLAP